jgi:proline iminopeptidase
MLMPDYTGKLYPPIEPFRVGRLRVSDLHEIYYEEVGTVGKQPAVFLHGGPGVGCIPDYRRFFDPRAYHVVLPDQRGAGKSTPHAELRENTTWDLVEDLERLRAQLGLGPWVVFGGSWGSLLALCYAIKHPEAVKAIIIRGVFLGDRAGSDWLFKYGMSEVYPDAWDEFRGHIPPDERSDLLKAYATRLHDLPPEAGLEFAVAWSKWEGSAVTVVPQPDVLDFFAESHTAVSIGRLESWYTYKDFFLPSDRYVLDNVGRFAHIPLRMVQGRYDLICPMRAAWELQRAHPNSKLNIVALGAHSPLDDGMVDGLTAAAEEFKSK